MENISRKHEETEESTSTPSSEMCDPDSMRDTEFCFDVTATYKSTTAAGQYNLPTYQNQPIRSLSPHHHVDRMPDSTMMSINTCSHSPKHDSYSPYPVRLKTDNDDYLNDLRTSIGQQLSHGYSKTDNLKTFISKKKVKPSHNMFYLPSEYIGDDATVSSSVLPSKETVDSPLRLYESKSESPRSASKSGYIMKSKSPESSRNMEDFLAPSSYPSHHKSGEKLYHSPRSKPSLSVDTSKITMSSSTQESPTKTRYEGILHHHQQQQLHPQQQHHHQQHHQHQQQQHSRIHYRLSTFSKTQTKPMSEESEFQQNTKQQLPSIPFIQQQSEPFVEDFPRPITRYRSSSESRLLSSDRFILGLDPELCPQSHIPLSPRGSNGSICSVRSSNADSAVDVLTPDEDYHTNEISATESVDWFKGTTGSNLHQSLNQKIKESSETLKTECEDVFNISSHIRKIPSVVISDHSEPSVISRLSPEWSTESVSNEENTSSLLTLQRQCSSQSLTSEDSVTSLSSLSCRSDSYLSLTDFTDSEEAQTPKPTVPKVKVSLCFYLLNDET